MKPKAICKRCDYIWTPRDPKTKPKACPKCKRYDYDTPISSARKDK